MDLISVLLTIQGDDIRKNYSAGCPTIQKNYGPFAFEGRVIFTYNLLEGTVANVYVLVTERRAVCVMAAPSAADLYVHSN